VYEWPRAAVRGLLLRGDTDFGLDSLGLVELEQCERERCRGWRAVSLVSEHGGGGGGSEHGGGCVHVCDLVGVSVVVDEDGCGGGCGREVAFFFLASETSSKRMVFS